MSKENSSFHPSFAFKHMGANQKGDAEIFKALFSGKFCHKPYKGWFVKQAGVWRRDTMGEHYAAVEKVAVEYEQAANRISAKISNLTNSGNVAEAERYINLQETARRRANKLRTVAGLEACLKIVKRDPVFNYLEPQ